MIFSDNERESAFSVRETISIPILNSTVKKFLNKKHPQNNLEDVFSMYQFKLYENLLKGYLLQPPGNRATPMNTTVNTASTMNNELRKRI